MVYVQVRTHTSLTYHIPVKTKQNVLITYFITDHCLDRQPWLADFENLFLF